MYHFKGFIQYLYMEPKGESRVWLVAKPRRILWKTLNGPIWVGQTKYKYGIFLTQGSNLGLLCLLHQHVGSLPLVPPGKHRNMDMQLTHHHHHQWEKEKKHSKETCWYTPLSHSLVVVSWLLSSWGLVISICIMQIHDATSGENIFSSLCWPWNK